jgi:hypothetical protein
MVRITIEIDEASALLSARPAVSGTETPGEADGGVAADDQSPDVAAYAMRRDATDAGGPPDWLVEAIAGQRPGGLEAPATAFPAAADALDGGSAPGRDEDRAE